MLTTQRHANPLLWAALAFAGVMVALACGPAQDGGDGVAPTPTLYIIDGSSPSEIATAMARPTATPYPPGYVPPTDLPTYTPLPTLRNYDVAPTMAESAVSGAAGAQSTSEELLDELVRFASMEPYIYYSIARVRAGPGHRDVTVRPGLLHRRQTLEVLSTYRGHLPDSIDIASDHVNIPQSPLTVGSEYIVFVTKGWYLTGDAADTEGRGLTQEQLDALGGEAYFRSIEQLWLLSEGQAYHLPNTYLFGFEHTGLNHSEAGRAIGRTVALADLESTLRMLPAQQRVAPPTPTPTPLPETALATLAGNTGAYDAVARVRVLFHTDHAIEYESVVWPEDSRLHPVFGKWQRSNMEVVETWHGTLPDKFAIVNDFFGGGIVNQSLDVGREYVLFVVKKWLLESEHPDDDRRFHYTRQQLDALGGEGYAYFITQAWVIDGDNALRVPRDHITQEDGSPAGHLAAARQGGIAMPLSRLRSIIATAAGSR